MCIRDRCDKNSINVDISPDMVEYRVNELTGQEVPDMQALTPAVIAKYKGAYKDDFARRNATLLLDDVKVKTNMLKFEIGKTDYVFTGARAK